MATTKLEKLKKELEQLKLDLESVYGDERKKLIRKILKLEMKVRELNSISERTREALRYKKIREN